MNSPLVTVFMAVYNGQKYISEAINSILNQTFRDFELLIIDDGSTDNTIDNIKLFTDDRIRLIQNHKNLGLFVTRNYGIDQAKGKYFAILDSDDIAFPNRLQIQVNFMERNPQYALCGAKAKVINQMGEEIDVLIPPYKEDIVHPYLLFANSFINSTTLIKTEVLKVITYRKNYEPAEDYDLFVRIAEKYPVSNLNQFLTKYRLHDHNISSTSADKRVRGEKRIIENQLLKFFTFEEIQERKLIDFHHIFLTKFFFESNYAMEHFESYLIELNDRNKLFKVFNETSFSKVILWLYISVNKSFGIKPSSFLKFIQSKLVTSSSLTFAHVKHLVRNISL